MWNTALMGITSTVSTHHSLHQQQHQHAWCQQWHEEILPESQGTRPSGCPFLKAQVSHIDGFVYVQFPGLTKSKPLPQCQKATAMPRHWGHDPQGLCPSSEQAAKARPVVAGHPLAAPAAAEWLGTSCRARAGHEVPSMSGRLCTRALSHIVLRLPLVRQHVW